MAFTPWDSTETQYTAGSMVQDSNGRFYVLRGNATTGTHPSADANWLPLNMLDRVPTIAAGGDWVSPIAKWSSPRALARFVIDRWGLPRSSYFQHTEIWSPNTQWANWSALGGSSGHGPSWGTGAQSSVSSHAPGGSTTNAVNTAPSLGIVVDGVSSGLSKMALFYQAISQMSADSLMVADFESAFVTDHANFTFLMGFAGNGDPISAIASGAYFLADPANANWKAVCANGGSQVQVDTGIPIATGSGNPHKFSVVLVGSGIADDVAPHGLFYIDDQLVATVTGIDVPNDAGTPRVGCLVAGGQVLSGATANKSLVLGPVTYTPITKR